MKERFESSYRSNWRQAEAAITQSLGISAALWGSVAYGIYDNMKKSGTMDVVRLKARKVLVNTGIPPGVAGFLIQIFSSDEPQYQT